MAEAIRELLEKNDENNLITKRIIGLFGLSRDDKIEYILLKMQFQELENPGWLLIEHIQRYIRRQFPTLADDTVKKWSKITMSAIIELRKVKALQETLPEEDQ